MAGLQPFPAHRPGPTVGWTASERINPCPRRPRRHRSVPSERCALAPFWQGVTMEDKQLIDRINELAHEEHQLFGKESQGKASDADRQRLRSLQVTLDQC